MPRGVNASGDLKGAAKATHEAKFAREGEQPEEGGGRGGSPGRGFDRQGNLVGAAKMAHEAKMEREGGGGGGSPPGRGGGGGSPGQGYDRQGNLVGAAKSAKEGRLMGAAAQKHQAKMQREGQQP